MFSKRPTASAPFWNRNEGIAAPCAIFGILAGLAVTAAASGTLTSTFQRQAGPFAAPSGTGLRDLDVAGGDGTLTVTSVLKIWEDICLKAVDRQPGGA